MTASITEQTLLDDLAAAIHKRHEAGLRLRDAQNSLREATEAVKQAELDLLQAQAAITNACTPEEYKDDWILGI